MSIAVILDTFKGTIDLAIQEFAKVAGAKVCEIIDEKKDELWKTGLDVALTKFNDDPDFNKSMMQKITDAVEKNISELKLGSKEEPVVTGGSLFKRKSIRYRGRKQRKSRKQHRRLENTV